MKHLVECIVIGNVRVLVDINADNVAVTILDHGDSIIRLSGKSVLDL